MRPRISSNVAAIQRRMERRRTLVVQELERAAVILGGRLSGQSKRLMQENIYDIPIPLKRASDRMLPRSSPIRQRTTKGKHGRWWRTGNLKRSEGWRTLGPSIILTNNALYAVYRYWLGTRRGRRIRTRGIRSIQWQARAVRTMWNQVMAVRREALVRALTRR
jgi:hypothetical protein